MLTKEQLEVRRAMITATDCRKIVGLDPYGNGPLSVYLDKMGQGEESIETFPMQVGNTLEALAIAEAARRLDLGIVAGSAKTVTHPTEPWAGATLDGILEGPAGRYVIEAKAVGFRKAHEWGEDGDPEGVPEHVLVQVIWQQWVAGIHEGFVTAVFGTECRVYPVQYDAELAQALRDACHEFWTKHVVPRVPPAPTERDSVEHIKAIYPRVKNAGLVPSTPAVELLAQQYFEAAEAEKTASEAKELAKQALMACIGDAEGILGAGWRCTWKDSPERIQQAYTVKASRRFDMRKVKS